MKEIFDINLPDYFASNVHLDYFEDQLVIAELGHSSYNPEDKMDSYPLRLKAYSLILVLSGEIDIEVNYLEHNLKKQTTMHLSANDIILNVSHSADFTGYLILFSSEFRSEIMGMTTGIRLPKSGELKRAYPIQKFDEVEFSRVRGNIEHIQSYIADTTHLYRSSMIRNEVMSLFWDIDNSRRKSHGEIQVNLTHSELLRERFRDLLVDECRRHRDVAFYAHELCVTPDYLSRVIREYDGGSAMKWIANALVMEAKCLMRQPGKSINQIAFELNFPDLSTFGKFFKRHTGVSPGGYKKITQG